MPILCYKYGAGIKIGVRCISTGEWEVGKEVKDKLTQLRDKSLKKEVDVTPITWEHVCFAELYSEHYYVITCNDCSTLSMWRRQPLFPSLATDRWKISHLTTPPRTCMASLASEDERLSHTQLRGRVSGALLRVMGCVAVVTNSPAFAAGKLATG